MKVKIIGVPTDFGANRRGVDMGASAIRYADLVAELQQLNLRVEDLGNIYPELVSNNSNSQADRKIMQKLYTCLATKVRQVITNNNLPVILGGDHSIALGSTAGAVQLNNKGIIWFDAHGDLNTFQTSPTGNIHGMALAAVTGSGEGKLNELLGCNLMIDPKRVVVIGVRSLDLEERKLVENSEITVFTIADIDKLGIYQVMNRAIAISSSNNRQVHVSLDLDVIDPLEAPGVGTPVPGGLDYREAHLAMEMIAKANILSSLEVVEVNPILDYKNQTAQLAVELIKSLLGEKIL